MIREIRSLFASLLAGAVIAGCAVGAAPSGDASEAVGTAKEPLLAFGYYRTYYSDAAHTNAVGWYNYDCDLSNRYLEGDTSKYFEQYSYDCPGYDSASLPSDDCYICSTSIAGDKPVKDCSPVVCP